MKSQISVLPKNEVTEIIYTKVAKIAKGNG